MRSPVLVAVLVASLFWAAPALGATYTVTGLGDTNDPQGCGGAIQPDLYQCPTLRDAIYEVGRDSNPDLITLPAGTIALTTGQLPISYDVTIVGVATRSTIIQAATEARIFELGFGTPTVSLTNLTLTGGSPTSGDGGNILAGAESSLLLSYTRVTGASALNGGAIASAGKVAITSSLIDNNHAGSAGSGLYLNGSSSATELLLLNSTVARNTVTEPSGGTIRATGTNGSVALQHATVAQNTGFAFTLDASQSVTVNASILANVSNCNAALLTGQQNVVTGAPTECGLDAGTNRLNATPQLSSDLVDAGGQTNVLTFGASSPAVDYVTPCLASTDQRPFYRTAAGEQACDAGAYEQSGLEVVPEPPQPTPTPAPPVATPTPAPPVATATAEPTAVPNKSVVAEETDGRVLVRDPKSKRFVPLDKATIVNGSEIDAREGKVTIIPSTPGEAATFYDGIFKISQTKGVTTLTLSEALDCKKGKARAAAKKPKTRKLWGDGKGKFRTKGSYSAATIRGTQWLVSDTCTTTTTKVTQGVVTVDDFSKPKPIVVRKGKHYTARARNR
jgi:hypothetical protein